MAPSTPRTLQPVASSARGLQSRQERLRLALLPNALTEIDSGGSSTATAPLRPRGLTFRGTRTPAGGTPSAPGLRPRSRATHLLNARSMMPVPLFRSTHCATIHGDAEYSARAIWPHRTQATRRTTTRQRPIGPDQTLACASAASTDGGSHRRAGRCSISAACQRSIPPTRSTPDCRCFIVMDFATEASKAPNLDSTACSNRDTFLSCRSCSGSKPSPSAAPSDRPQSRCYGLRADRSAST